MQKVQKINTTFHIRSLAKVQPLTENQSAAMSAWFSGHNIAMLGCAGTGKSYLGMFLALHALLSGEEINKLIIIRSAVQVRNVGFMPGEYDEKISHFEDPYHGICDQLFPYTRCYENLKKGGYVEFYTTSFLRGVTFDNSVVLMDEIQSFNAHELDSAITRVGENSRVILCGDGIQSDLRGLERRGFHDIIKILKILPNFTITNFTTDDIVRSGFVRDYIIARELQGLEC